jgi:predicted Zn-dependent protease
MGEVSRPVEKLFMDRKYSEMIYLRFNLEEYKSEEEEFKGGKLFSSSASSALIGRFEAFDGKDAYYGAERLDGARADERNIRRLVRKVERNMIRVPIVVPEKEIIYPMEGGKAKEKEISIDKEVIRSLREASKVRGRFPCLTSYFFEHSKSYGIDSNGIEVFEDVPTLMMSLKVELPLDRTIRRRVGLIPRGEKDIKRIFNCFKFIPDLTLEQRLRSCSEPSQLMIELSKLASQLSKGGERVTPGFYGVVSPLTVLSHEIVGHQFEQETIQERGSLDRSKFYPAEFFKRGMKVARESFSLIDDPTLRLGKERFIPIGSFKYDAEMFEGERKILIDRGVVTGRMLGSRYSEGNEVGNAKAYEEYAFPIPRMSNLYIPPLMGGPKSIEELVECTSSRQVIFSMKSMGQVEDDACFEIGRVGCGEYVRIDPSAENYIYRKGELVPIKNRFFFSGGIYQTLGEITLAGEKLLVYQPGRCSKKNPTMYGGSEVYVSELTPLALLKLQVCTRKRYRHPIKRAFR